MNESVKFQFPPLAPLEYQTIILGLWHSSRMLLGEIAAARGAAEAIKLKAQLIQRLKNLGMAGAPIGQEVRALGLFLDMLERLPVFPERIDNRGAHAPDRD